VLGAGKSGEVSAPVDGDKDGAVGEGDSDGASDCEGTVGAV